MQRINCTGAHEFKGGQGGRLAKTMGGGNPSNNARKRIGIKKITATTHGRGEKRGGGSNNRQSSETSKYYPWRE